MKEATGELNVTVIVVITVGLLSAFFFTIIWPRLNNNLKSNTKCSDAICAPVCNKATKKCEPNWDDKSKKTVKCVYKKDKNDKGIDIVCPYKG